MLEQKITLNIDKQTRMFKLNLIEKLKKAEKQIEEGKTIDANLIFHHMKEKYEY